jgi:cytochrome P450
MLESDFFLAGTDTSTASMEWVIGHLFQAPPEKLERLQQELDNLNVSETSLLKQTDLTPERVPYLYAGIKETFR